MSLSVEKQEHPEVQNHTKQASGPGGSRGPHMSAPFGTPRDTLPRWRVAISVSGSWDLGQ